MLKIVALALLSFSAESVQVNVLANGATGSKTKSVITNAMLMASKKKRDTMQRIEDLEAWEDAGMALTLHESVSDSDLKTMSNTITEDAYDKMLHRIADLGSRYVLHRGNKLAEEFITKELEDAGFTVKKNTWEYQTQGTSIMELGERVGTEQNAQLSNIVGYKEGTDLAHETILIGAHYDSVNWKSGTDVAAPGVDDNASGLAAALLVAKALKDLKLRRSVLVVAFNAEEEGLLGSKQFVKTAMKDYPPISAALIADEVAFPGRPGKTRRAIFETSGKNDANRAIVDTMAHTVKDELSELAGFEVNYHGFGSDHMSFLRAGIPAVLLIERDDEWHADAVGHSSQDTFDGLSMDFGATMARLLLRSSVHLAHPE